MYQITVRHSGKSKFNRVERSLELVKTIKAAREAIEQVASSWYNLINGRVVDQGDRIEFRATGWGVAVYYEKLEQHEPKPHTRIRYEYADRHGVTRVWIEGDIGDEEEILAIAEEKLFAYAQQYGHLWHHYTGRWVTNSGVTAGFYDIQ